MPVSSSAVDDTEEDDYLTMSFEEPTSTSKHETLTQKKKRLARQAEERSRSKSKTEIANEERKKREEALSTANINENSKAFKMMAARGYKPGTALGKASDTKDDRLTEPIGLEMKEGRGGIGADSEKKRKFREEVDKIQDIEKRQKVDAEEFRVRQQQEREEKKIEGQIYGAMKVAQGLADEDTAEPSLRQQNVLWRGLVRDRMQKERDRRLRHDFDKSLTKLPTYDAHEEDADDKLAIDRKAYLEVVDLELDQDDEELDTFEALPGSERLEQLVQYLRDRWNYCFWCKYQYPDSTMDGCPGLKEDDHD